jgi:glycine C-acetyltransferase
VLPRNGERASQVLNFCANNYLGLEGRPTTRARRRPPRTRWTLRLRHGLGALHLRHADLHKRWRPRSRFLGTEDTILYAACFDANGGLFETLLGEQDAIMSDALNHASIIDGIRLCKAQRYRYANDDMADLERSCRPAKPAARAHHLVATDGVFSMDGDIARSDPSATLAERYGALVHGRRLPCHRLRRPTGRGTPSTAA